MRRHETPNAAASEILAPLASTLPSAMEAARPPLARLFPCLACGALAVWLLASIAQGGIDVLVLGILAAIVAWKVGRRALRPR